MLIGMREEWQSYPVRVSANSLVRVRADKIEIASFFGITPRVCTFIFRHNTSCLYIVQSTFLLTPTASGIVVIKFNYTINQAKYSHHHQLVLPSVLQIRILQFAKCGSNAHPRGLANPASAHPLEPIQKSANTLAASHFLQLQPPTSNITSLVSHNDEAALPLPGQPRL